MTTLTVPQIAALAARHGCPANRLAFWTAVALAESGGNPDSIGDKDNPKPGCQSVGLWQINSCPKRDAKGGPPRFGTEPARLRDPDTNAESARVISGNWTNSGPWTTAAKARLQEPAVARQLSGLNLSSEPAPAAVVGPAPGAGSGGKPSFWLRLAMFVVGLVLIVAGAVIITGQTLPSPRLPTNPQTPDDDDPTGTDTGSAVGQSTDGPEIPDETMMVA